MTPGAQLARAREAHGWSVVEVADQLNLAPRQVQAIEDDNYGALPGLAITRGFIRTYAKLLKIDAVPLLSGMVTPPSMAIDAKPLRRALPQANFSDSRLGAGSNHKVSSTSYTVLLALLLVVGAGVTADHFGVLPSSFDAITSHLHGGFDSLRGAKVTPGVDAPAMAASSSVVTPAQTDVSQSATMMTLPSPVAPDARPSAAPSVAATNLPVPQVLAAAPSAVSATPSGDNQLVLTLRKDSWIEIKGAGKNAVASKLYPAGSVETFDISQPVQLIIGNAAGVDASLRGVPLELRKASKNNVARLNLK